MARGTCEAMARGGIYDQLAGGFARYAVDADWVVPALREDALRQRPAPARLHPPVAQHRRSPRSPDRLRDSRVHRPRSRHRRGRLRLGPRRRHDSSTVSGSRARPTSGPRPSWSRCSAGGRRRGPPRCSPSPTHGTFEHGSSTLQLRRGPGRPGVVGAHAARPCSRPGRARPQPAATTRSSPRGTAWPSPVSPTPGALLDRPDLVDAAVRCADFVVTTPRRRRPPAPGLARRRRRGRGRCRRRPRQPRRGPARAPPGDRRPALARRRPGELLDVALVHFRDADGLVHDTADDAEQLFTRPRSQADNAEPSGVSSLAGAWLTYAALTGSTRAPRAGRRGPRQRRRARRPGPALRRLGARRGRGRASPARSRSRSSARARRPRRCCDTTRRQHLPRPRPRPRRAGRPRPAAARRRARSWEVSRRHTSAVGSSVTHRSPTSTALERALARPRGRPLPSMRVTASPETQTSPSPASTHTRPSRPMTLPCRAT